MAKKSNFYDTNGRITANAGSDIDGAYVFPFCRGFCSYNCPVSGENVNKSSYKRAALSSFLCFHFTWAKEIIGWLGVPHVYGWQFVVMFALMAFCSHVAGCQTGRRTGRRTTIKSAKKTPKWPRSATTTHVFPEPKMCLCLCMSA